MAGVVEHKHLIIRAEVSDPPGKADLVYMEQWFKNLIMKIGMVLLAGPYVRYVDAEGNAGMTGVAIIETSHIAMHIWDEASPALMQFDVYTCGALDPEIIFDALKEFEPKKIEWTFIDREHNLRTVLGAGIR